MLEFDDVTPLPDHLMPDEDEAYDPDQQEYETQKKRRRVKERIVREELDATYKRFGFAKSLKEYREEEIPSTDWLINGLIEKRVPVIIQGKPASGKSTLRDDLIRALVTGLTMFTDTRYAVNLWAGNLGLLDLEMGHRQTMVRLARLPMNERAAERVLPLSVTHGFDILSEMTYQNLLAECLSNNIKVLILDPQVHIHNFENENDNAEAAQVTRQLSRLIEEADLISLILVSHTPDGTNVPVGAELKVRGATHWMGWAAYVINCYWDTEADTYHIKVGKARERNEATDWLFKVKQVSINEEGELVLSAPKRSVGGHDEEYEEKLSKIKTVVVEFLRDNDGCSGNALKDHMMSSGHMGKDKTTAGTYLNALLAEDPPFIWVDKSSKPAHKWHLIEG